MGRQFVRKSLSHLEGTIKTNAQKKIFLCYSTSPQQRLTNVFGFHQIDTKFMKHKKDDEMERQ